MKALLVVAALAACGVVAWSLVHEPDAKPLRRPETDLPTRDPHPTPKERKLVVHVVARRGRTPVAGARVEATFDAVGDGAAAVVEATTDGAGDATLSPPALATNCEATVRADGFVRGWNAAVPVADGRTTSEILLLAGRAVEGRVVDAESRAPLAGATIVARPTRDRAAPEFGRATADADGAFRIEGVSTNEPVSVEIRAAGHVAVVRDGLAWSTGRVDVPMPPARVVRGSVNWRDHDVVGGRVSGAVVTIRRRDSAEVLMATTDARGEFEIDGTPFGAGVVIRGEYRKESGELLVSDPEDLDDEIKAYKLLVGPRPALAVRVTDPAGAPVDGCPVTIWPDVPTADSQETAELMEHSESGVATWDAVPPGKWRLVADGAPSAPFETSIELAVGEKRAIDARLTEGATIAGVVLDADGHGVAGARVESRNDRVSTRRVETDAEGRFRLVGLTPGARTLDVRAKDGAPHARVEAAAPSEGVRVALPRACRLTVRVRLPEGSVYPESVSASFPDDAAVELATRQAKDPRDAVAFAAPSARGVVLLQAAGCADARMPYAVGPDGECDLGTWAPRKTLRFALTVTDEDGAPIVGATVAVAPQSGSAGTVVDREGADGAHELFGVVAGPARLSVSAPGFETKDVRVEAAESSKPPTVALAAAR